MSTLNEIAAQMPVIQSDKNELRRCVMHLWRTYNGFGLNLKNSKKDGNSPHIIKDVDANSPAHYAGVLANDLVIKVGNKVVEYEKFDTVLRLIKDQSKRDKKVDLVLVNSQYYTEFKQRNEKNSGKKIDYNSPIVLSQMKYYESPLNNPNSGIVTMSQSMNNLTNGVESASTTAVAAMAASEPRLCHLLTWSKYDGYGFCAAYNNEGVFVKNVEPNSPAQMGGLRDYDRIIEINGKRVHPKDKEAISKIITRHKTSGMSGSNSKGSVTTLKSQSGYSVATGKSTKSTKSATSQIPPSNNSYLNVFVVDPNTYNLLTSKKVDISTRNKSLKWRECFTPPEDSVQEILEQRQLQEDQQQNTLNRVCYKFFSSN
jgi:C-terminal processing protease CtpA/Prc